jgi:hypothetical protein
LECLNWTEFEKDVSFLVLPFRMKEQSNPLASSTYEKKKMESSINFKSSCAVLSTTKTKDLQFEASKLDRI